MPIVLRGQNNHTGEEKIINPNLRITRNFAKVNGVKLFYFDTKGDYETIICLHGRWGRAESWLDFINQYKSNYRIIAPDLRGHGLSDKPISQYTAEEIGTDIVELMELIDVESAIIVGHSMGGYIGGYISAIYPEKVKSLALLDKSARGPNQQENSTRDNTKPIDPLTNDWPLPFSSIKEAKNFLRSKFPSKLSYEYFACSLIEDSSGVNMMFSSQAIAENIKNYKDWFELLYKIECPVLIIRSSKKDAVTDEALIKMKEYLKNSMSFDMSKPDHSVHLGDPEEFYDYFNKFLDWSSKIR